MQPQLHWTNRIPNIQNHNNMLKGLVENQHKPRTIEITIEILSTPCGIKKILKRNTFLTTKNSRRRNVIVPRYFVVSLIVDNQLSCGDHVKKLSVTTSQPQSFWQRVLSTKATFIASN